MKHLRPDYDSIQDVASMTSIGEDEPVFILRARDPLAPNIVRAWAEDLKEHGGNLTLVISVLQWAHNMEAYREEHFPDAHLPDVPDLSKLRA